MNKDRVLYVAGVGPGKKELVVPEVLSIIENSDVLIGGRRNLSVFEDLPGEKVVITDNLEEIIKYIEDNVEYRKITVLVSGDPGVFSMLGYLKENLENIHLEVMPGISSLQYLCTKLKTNWNEACILSVHGREQSNLLKIIKDNRKTVLFTGGKASPENVCRDLINAGMNDLKVSVGEKLSYPEERITTGAPETLADKKFDSLSLMLIENLNNELSSAEDKSSSDEKVWRHETPGIPDNLFIRGDVPMTKEEVRAVTLAKLRLNRNSIVYDIGAGTGSVTVECGLRCSKGMVYSIEKEAAAVDLIKKNIDKFGLVNVNVIHGEASAALSTLPEADRVFIGGSGDSMENILNKLKSFAKNVRVVINTVTIDSTYKAIEALESKGFSDVDIVCISVSKSRSAGKKHLMQALNPVYIISAETGGRI